MIPPDTWVGHFGYNECASLLGGGGFPQRPKEAGLWLAGQMQDHAALLREAAWHVCRTIRKWAEW